MSAAITKRANELDQSIGAPILEALIFLCRLAMTLAFMSPAILMNVASLQSRGPVMCFASIALVLGAAIALHRAIHSQGGGEKALFLIMAPVLVFMSMFTAIRNIGGIRETAAEARQVQKDTNDDLKKKRAALEARRKAQADVAGEVSSKVIEGNIEALKAKYIHKWNATNGCQPDQVASPEAKALCNGVRDLQIKFDAAKERDKLQALIDGWETKPETRQASAPLGVPVSNDALIHALDRAGFKMDGSEIDYAYEAGFVLALELIAAAAPLMFGLVLPETRRRRSIERVAIKAPKPRRASAPVSEPKPKGRARLASLVSRITARRKEAEAEIIAFPAGSAHEFNRRFFEPSDDPKAKIAAGEVQRRYRADCARHGVEHLETAAFSQALQKLVEYRRTDGGRTYFHGVKWRDVPLPAMPPQGPRVVVDNTLNAASLRFASLG
jgi:hypothetical protein